jgi:hypothetical protein
VRDKRGVVMDLDLESIEYPMTLSKIRRGTRRSDEEIVDAMNNRRYDWKEIEDAMRKSKIRGNSIAGWR